MILRKLKLSQKEKDTIDIQTGRNWYMDMADYYISQWRNSGDYQEMMNLYSAVEGVINPNDYNYILNPFNIDVDTDRIKTGGRLRDYNIIRGIVNLLMGEFGRRVHEYSVTDFNPNDEIKYKDQLLIKTKQYYAQLAVNSLNEQGFPTGQNSKEMPTYEQFLQDFKRDYDQNRVITGQEAIDYIRFHQEIDDKLLDLYWDWVIVGRCFSFKEVRFDDVTYEYVPAHEIFVPNETHSKYIEDRSYVIRRRVIPISKVIDIFNDELTEDEIKLLEKKYLNKHLSTGFEQYWNFGHRGYVKYAKNMQECTYDGFFQNNTQGIEVFHIQFKSFRKIGELTYIDELGQVSKMEVGENYVLNKEQGDISIKWKWINQVEEVWKLAQEVYLGMKPLKTNRSELNNNSSQKLSYNGIISRTKVGQINSIVKEGIPYQLLINGQHYQLEKILNKNKDKILIMPYGLIPKKKGISAKEQMYHADATSILWVDETAPNAALSAQMIKSVDLSLGNYIKETYGIIQLIKQSYWDSIGMNSQRYSDIAQGAGKAVTEQAIVRSSLITYELNRLIDKLLQRDYQGLLDYSKFAWINGKKLNYIRTDGSRAFIELNQDDAIYHLETDYGIFVKDSVGMTEAINQYRQLGLAFAQNGGNMSGMAELFTNNNMEKLKDIIQKIEDKNNKYKEQLQEAQNAHEKEIKEVEKETATINQDTEKYKADRQYQGVVDSATIRTSNNGHNEPKVPNDVDRQLANHKIENDNKKISIEEQKLIQNKINNNNN